jgi:DNA polymerase-3 subunit beta
MLISVNDDTLTLSAFDYETARRARVQGTDGEEGRIRVNASTLKAAIAALPKGAKARTTVTADDNALHVGPATLPAMPAEEYPTLPDMPAHVAIVDGAALARIIPGVSVAAGTDGTLPMLLGVRFTFSANGAEIAATDRYRLAVDTLPWTVVTEDMPGEVIVPAKALTEYASKSAKVDKVNVYAGVNPADGIPVFGLSDGNRDLFMHCITGKYLRVAQLLRDDSPVNLTVNGPALTDVVRRLKPLAGRNEAIRLDYAASELKLSVFADSGSSTSIATEAIPANADVPEFVIQFNPGYLESMLTAITGDVTFGMVTSQKSATMSSANMTRRAILAPIRFAE